MAELYLGIDLGTSGARAVVIDAAGHLVSTGKSAHADHPGSPRASSVWWAATEQAVLAALEDVDARDVRAMAVDGTSGTMLAIDAMGVPLSDGVMYNDVCTDTDLLDRITAASPETTAARGATSGLARAVQLLAHKPARVVHQADWIAGQFSGRWISDENNALKTGYDPVSGVWPDWIAEVIDPAVLPEVVAPGTVVGQVGDTLFGLSPDCAVVAGTTDGCASFLATGAAQAGEGVTALGSTLTIKLLSDQPVFAPQFGIYSHKILGLWLAGGASNTGGNALLSVFSASEIAALSTRIDPETDTGLSYYPLAKPGERFPINDPEHAPVMGPRPAADSTHLQAMFEGIADIEAQAYARLAELGAPALRSVRSVGGGAANPAWCRIRARRLSVTMPEPLSGEAAFGTALLARSAL
ncbi:carbohydrate kinase [Roseobacter denitrificans]|uniref:Xylulose kinase, putative n=1 Tax=Roseobacter denitrificans (strain ATCC 33942 / OCh 114) TaxID=375451 RepID=Q162I7_ROSDO|nr:FGGY-family carbohydrate kinase [Roseobacter denitrificans]ABG33106.1 xylulose kinase, putative [Roseobacter denitrificans OCh 114]AVL52474.1 carbohydrate kinase [Roseobacter denitrificans]SFG07852.1 xylulokinase [Roseobacter denitrificans OCh 114]